MSLCVCLASLGSWVQELDHNGEPTGRRRWQHTEDVTAALRPLAPPVLLRVAFFNGRRNIHLAAAPGAADLGLTFRFERE